MRNPSGSQRGSEALVERFVDRHREARRHERPAPLGVLTPVGQRYQIINPPVDIVPHRPAENKPPRRKSTQHHTRRNYAVPVVRIDRFPMLRDDERIDADDCEDLNLESTLPASPTTLLGAQALRRFPKERLRSSEGRVKAIRCASVIGPNLRVMTRDGECCTG